MIVLVSSAPIAQLGTPDRSTVAEQTLTLLLDGITAADYLARVRDPEPRALGRELLDVAARAEPLGPRIDVDLCWRGRPPCATAAAALAGFPLTPEVADLLSR
jgi:hypothetical protein